MLAQSLRCLLMPLACRASHAAVAVGYKVGRAGQRTLSMLRGRRDLGTALQYSKHRLVEVVYPGACLAWGVAKGRLKGQPARE